MSVTALLLSLSIGAVSGLRAMTAPAAVSWAARLGLLHVEGSFLAILGHAFTPWILTLLALFELVTDQLPKTPSRKTPLSFGTRLVTGALSGAAIGLGSGVLLGGLALGVAGAVIGTLGGHAVRAWLAGAFENDRPAAFIEDAIALGSALLIVVALP